MLDGLVKEQYLHKNMKMVSYFSCF